jgi:hypothetical protein
MTMPYCHTILASKGAHSASGGAWQRGDSGEGENRAPERHALRQLAAHLWQAIGTEMFDVSFAFWVPESGGTCKHK